MKSSLAVSFFAVMGTAIAVWGYNAIQPSHDHGSPACGHVRAVHAALDSRAREHDSAGSLAPPCESTDVARKSGPWSARTTWHDGRVPGRGSKVHIPRGIDVELDTADEKSQIDWIRVDGKLAFRTDRDTAIALKTLVVGDGGLLHVGTRDDPVRDLVKARIVFLPRGPRDRLRDPYDMAGGLISMGTVQMVSSAKTPHSPASVPIERGTDRIRLASKALGWRQGDLVLIPGVSAEADQDELRRISAIEDGGLSVRLDQALAFEHKAPPRVMVPVANLSRNIEVASLKSEPLEARGHVMLMHAETGTVIDGAAFVHLGRTDTRFAHTTPVAGADQKTLPGTDANSIGRYPVHFHVRSGGRLGVPPHIVRNSVVVGSPKYGIVNHGGHVVAEGNVTFRVAGSHFVAENGSEVGAFRHNVAVRSSGSGESAVENRMTIYDFGHGGHGFWLQSPAVELSDNWTSGHEHAAIFYMGMPFKDGGREVFFDAANIGDPAYVEDLGGGRVRTSDVTFRYARNTAVASRLGMELWYHKIQSVSREFSEIDGLVAWNVRGSALALPYCTHVSVRNALLVGSNRRNVAAVDVNGFTGDIVLEDSEIRNFSVGVRLPERGSNELRRVRLDNELDLEIPPPNARGRTIGLEDLGFHGPSGRARIAHVVAPGRGLDALAWSPAVPQSQAGSAGDWPKEQVYAVGAVDSAALPRSGKPGYIHGPAGDAKFMLRRGLLPLEIHPDDVAHGYRFAGLLLERAGDRVVWQTFSQEHRQLRVDPDGFVRIDFQLPNLAGRRLDFRIALPVNPNAVRRGANIDFWAQRAYCGRCGLDTLEEDAERFYATGRLDPLPLIAGACERWKATAVDLARPFKRDGGNAWFVNLPHLDHVADTAKAPRRSPYLLCEDNRIFGLPHSLHDEIRRSAHGDFSHWNQRLYFSASDGSDPNQNGRRYFLVRPPANETLRMANAATR